MTVQPHLKFNNYLYTLNNDHHVRIDTNYKHLEMKILENKGEQRRELLTPHFEKGGGAIVVLGCPSFRLSVSPSVCHNFISTQYLENKLIEFHHIVCIH